MHFESAVLVKCRIVKWKGKGRESEEMHSDHTVSWLHGHREYFWALGFSSREWI